MCSIYRFRFQDPSPEPSGYKKHIKKNKVRQHKKDEFLEILQPYVRELRAEVNKISYIFLSNKVCVFIVIIR